MNLTIITLGKLKEKYLKEAEAEYLKRLQAFAKVNIIEIKEESFSEKDKPEIIKAKEAEKIKNALSKFKDAYIITLDETGKLFSSTEFSQYFDNVIRLRPSDFGTTKQFNHLTFIIGGPLGLDKEIIKLSNLTLSMSKMTFTHQMVRVILLEQIYRAFMIKEGRKYHY